MPVLKSVSGLVGRGHCHHIYLQEPRLWGLGSKLSRNLIVEPVRLIQPRVCPVFPGSSSSQRHWLLFPLRSPHSVPVVLLPLSLPVLLWSSIGPTAPRLHAESCPAARHGGAGLAQEEEALTLAGAILWMQLHLLHFMPLKGPCNCARRQSWADLLPGPLLSWGRADYCGVTCGCLRRLRCGVGLGLLERRNTPLF